MSHDWYQRQILCKNYAQLGLSLREIGNRIQVETGTHMDDDAVQRAIDGNRLGNRRISLPMGQVYDKSKGALE